METVNTFTKGLVSDKHPLTIGLDTMTDALNATLITYNGNEMILQNDMGNSRLAVPESTKQVRLTIYQKTDDATSKGYNTDVNDVKDRLSDADISLRSAFKPIGVVEHGGILYIASLRDIYDDKGNKTTEFEIGSFPGPDFTNNDTQWHYEVIKDTLGVDLIIDNKINSECLDKVYILVDSANSELVTFKPGMPIYISVGDSDYQELLTIGENRKYFKLNFLNLLDNNRNITKKIEHCIEYDVNVSNTALKTFYFPNIKNTLLGFNLELENIDSFLIHPIEGTSEEELPYNTLNVPFLIDPNFPDEVKNKYYNRKPESQIINPECFYLYFDLFDIIQPSSVKADSYTIKYSLTNKNGDYIKIENDELLILNSKFTVEEKRIFYLNNNLYLSNQALLINIGKNKDVTITFTIYPEHRLNDSYFTVFYDDVPYHFEPYKIQMTIDLWLSPGLWNGLPLLVQTPQSLEAEEINKRIWFDNSKEEFKISIRENNVDANFGEDFFVNYGGSRNLFDSRIRSKNRTVYNVKYLGGRAVGSNEHLNEPILLVIDSSLKVDLSASVKMETDRNNDKHITSGKVYNNENTNVYKSGLGVKHKAGLIINLNYFNESYDLNLACSAQIVGYKNSAASGNVDSSERSLYLLGASGGCEFSIGDDVFQSYRSLSYFSKPASPWPDGYGHYDLIRGDKTHLTNNYIGYVDVNNNISNKNITSKNNLQEIWCGSYSPILMAVIQAKDRYAQKIFQTSGWEDNETLLLDPYNKVGNNESGIEHYYQKLLYVDGDIILKNDYSDKKLQPLLYLTQIKDDIEYLVSTLGKIHTINNNTLLGKLESLPIDNISSIPYSTDPYNRRIIIDHIYETFNISDDISKQGTGYYILQFYVKTLENGNELYIEVYNGPKANRDSYKPSIIADKKIYNLGTLSTLQKDYHGFLYNVVNINKQYLYILIPINITKNDLITVHLFNPNTNDTIEIRNMHFLKKMESNSDYEVKGAVVTYLEDVDLIKIHGAGMFKLYLDDSEIGYSKNYSIKAEGIYLPCQNGYYEIYTSSDYPNGTFILNKNTDGSVDTTIKVGSNSYEILH